MASATLKSMEAEVAHALEHINIPSYFIDEAGVIRWVNTAARRLVGDVEGRQFTSVVAPEDTRRARDASPAGCSGTWTRRTRPSCSSTTKAIASLSK